jgi:dimethylhistidine N-methyltransferase
VRSWRGFPAPQKTLPCRFFYDDAGSHLFERICQLPEYYLTRTEQKILEDRAPKMIAAAGGDLALIEFGSGSSCKTRILLDAVLDRQRRLHYTPIDISSEFLRASALSLLAAYDRLFVTALAAEYNDAIPLLPGHDGPRLILFLGSNIGNFEHEEAVGFLARIRRQMQKRDRILIGVDLVKERRILEAAYNDAAGVTEAFNKNLLLRVNRELGANFDPDRWEHAAPFVEEASRIEMRLVSPNRQAVFFGAFEQKVSFEEGEFIHTENSHKYTLASFAALCAAAGLGIQERWLDERKRFAVMLLKPGDA